MLDGQFIEKIKRKILPQRQESVAEVFPGFGVLRNGYWWKAPPHIIEEMGLKVEFGFDDAKLIDTCSFSVGIRKNAQRDLKNPQRAHEYEAIAYAGNKPGAEARLTRWVQDSQEALKAPKFVDRRTKSQDQASASENA